MFVPLSVTSVESPSIFFSDWRSIENGSKLVMSTGLSRKDKALESLFDMRHVAKQSGFVFNAVRQMLHESDWEIPQTNFSLGTDSRQNIISPSTLTSNDEVSNFVESLSQNEESCKVSEISVLFVSRDDAHVRRVPYEHELVLCLSQKLNLIDSSIHYNVNRVLLSGLPINDIRRLFFEVIL